MLAVTACGSDSSYKNDPRPPSPITITASIGPDSISVSPKRFGAGPISLVVVNQTTASQRLTLERNEIGQEPFRQQTSPINPHGTASLKADVQEGTYVVRVDGDGIKSTNLRVSAERASAQNELLQP
jgi:hypothetical protein